MNAGAVGSHVDAGSDRNSFCSGVGCTSSSNADMNRLAGSSDRGEEGAEADSPSYAELHVSADRCQVLLMVGESVGSVGGCTAFNTVVC